MPPVQLLADVDAGTLLRSLLVALVIVLPYGWVKLRQVRAARAAAGLDRPTPQQDPGPPDPRSLETVVARITELAGRGGEVDLPDECTVDGQPVDPTFAEVMVRDALGRSGLREVGRSPGSGTTTLRLAPTDGVDDPTEDPRR